MALPGGNEFRAETWSLYGVGMLVICLRLAARIRKRGFSHLQFDDYLTLNVVAWYTLLIVALNEVFFSGGSNFMTAEEQAALTPETTAERIAGSKWVVVVEEAMVLTVWTCKFGMLFLYRRITQGLKQSRFINAAFIWVAAGFVGTQLALFLNCRPFSDYWAVPTSHDQCWSYFNYQIVEASFNISGDIFVLIIAIPIIYKLQVPLLQRAILLGVFGMGIFIIVAALLTKLYSLVPSLLTYAYLNWYCREASVCVYVTNLPAIWTLLLDLFPGLRSIRKKTSKNASASDYYKGPSRNGTKLPSGGKGLYPLQQFDRLGSRGGTQVDQKGESTEYIVSPSTLESGGKNHHSHLQIKRDVSFTVRSESGGSEEDDIGALEKHAETPHTLYKSNCHAV